MPSQPAPRSRIGRSASGPGRGFALGGILIGAEAVHSPTLAIGAVMGVAFIAVSFRSLAGGVAFFVVLTFFDRLPGSPATGFTLVKAAGLVLALAWLAALAARRSGMPLLFRDHPWLAYTIVAFLTWSLASVLWEASWRWRWSSSSHRSWPARYACGPSP